MRRTAYHIIYVSMIYIPLLLLTSCDVHEWPSEPERVSLLLNLTYETEITEWKHIYDNGKVTESGIGETYDNTLPRGNIRYIVRAYPEGSTRASENYEEFVFTGDIADGYDRTLSISLTPGNYDIKVWSDLTESADDRPFYDAEEFSDISLTDTNSGSNDYRDAFRGTAGVTISGNIEEREAEEVEIIMERPLAKFEIITTDLEEFIENELTRVATRSAEEGTKATRVIDINNYIVRVYNANFFYLAPMAYNIFTDKPVSYETEILFDSSLEMLGEKEAAMGFDYVFINGNETSITLRMEILEKSGGEETSLSWTDAIQVPLKRNRHTLLRGRFLTMKATGGIGINKDYTGDINIVLPKTETNQD